MKNKNKTKEKIMSNEIVKTKKEFKPLPAGDYMLILKEFSEKATRNGKGVMLNATYEVAQGDDAGKKVFANYLVEHTSEKAQEIGNRELGKFLQAVGLEKGLEDLDYDRTRINDFLNEKFVATLSVKDPQEYTDYQGVQKMSKARNEIKEYKAR